MHANEKSIKILAVESSGPRGGIALAEGDRLVEEVVLEKGMRHGRELILAARDACDRAGWSPRQIGLVAVSIGPGSFTGIRIGVTLAKVMAWDAGAEVVAPCTLRVMAENAPAEAHRVVPVLDAKKGGVYAAVYRRAEDGFDEEIAPTLIEPVTLGERIERPAYVLGRGLKKAADALADCDRAPPEAWDPRPSVLARRGLDLYRDGATVEAMTLEPVYIRRPEPEELWERRQRERRTP